MEFCELFPNLASTQLGTEILFATKGKFATAYWRKTYTPTQSRMPDPPKPPTPPNVVFAEPKVAKNDEHCEAHTELSGSETTLPPQILDLMSDGLYGFCTYYPLLFSS